MSREKLRRAMSVGLFLLVALALLVGGVLVQRDPPRPPPKVDTPALLAEAGVQWSGEFLLAPGDTLTRKLSLSNTGKTSVKSVTMSSRVRTISAAGAPPLTDAVRLTIRQNGKNITPALKIEEIVNYELMFTETLKPEKNTELSFVYDFSAGDKKVGARDDVDANPYNAYQNTAFTVRYTLDRVTFIDPKDL